MGSSSSSSSSSSSPPPVEAPNTLLSNTRVKIQDFISEGEIAGFWPQSGTFGADPKISTYFDDTPLINPDGSANFNLSGVGFQFNYTVGASGQSVITNFGKTETLIPLPANTRVANPPNGAGPYKTVVTSFNTSMYPDADAIKVTVRIPSLLSTDNKGNTNKYTLTYAVDIATNGGSFISQGNISINGKCTSPYYKTLVYTLPKPNPPQNYYSWKVRIRRVSQNIMSIRTQNEIFVDTIAVVSANSFKYPHSALVALELSADQFGSIPTRSYEIKGIKVKIPEGYTPSAYNTDGTITEAIYPTVWDGTFAAAKVWTDNPAWIFYDLCTNDVYGLGNYIQEEWLDKWTIYQIAQECDEMVDDGDGGLEPKFTCNLAIQSQKEAYDLLMDMISIFRGMLYWANGRLFPVSNGPKTPVFNVSNSNVVDGNFTYSDTARNTRSTVAVVRWLDPENRYKENVEYVEDTEGIARYGYIEKEFAAFATISKGQAIRAANWLLGTEKQSTETITFQMAQEGNYLRPGDIFNVYDNFRTNTQQAGRIKTFDSTRTVLNLDRTVDFASADTYQISALVPKETIDTTGAITGSSQYNLLRNSQIEVRDVSSITNNVLTQTTSVTVSSPFSTGLYNGSVFILSNQNTGSGNFSRPIEYRCLATAEIEPNTYEVLGLQYFTGLNFTTSTGYSSVTSNPVIGDSTIPEPPGSLVISGVTGVLTNNNFFYNLDLKWSGSYSSVAYYKISGAIGGDPVALIGTSQNTGYVFSNTSTGDHTFYIGAVSDGGIESSYITNTFNIPTGNPLGPTVTLSGIQIVSNTDAALYPTGYKSRSFGISWGFDTGTNGYEPPSVQFLSGYRLSFLNPATDAALSSPIVIDGASTRSYQVTNTNITGFAGGARRSFKLYIETVDDYGNIESGASLIINNPSPRTPTYTSFYNDRNGLNYTISPNVNDTEVSGYYIWTGSSPTLRFDAAFFTGYTNAGNIPNSNSGNYDIYYAITDSWGTGDCTIYGPVSVGGGESVTGIRSNNNPYLFNGVSITGAGAISVGQEANTILISGDYGFFNLGFFLESMPDVTGVAIGEMISAKSFIYTGYAISRRSNGSANLSGSFYYCDLDNTNETTLGDFGITSASSNISESVTPISVPSFKKVGYHLTELATDSSKTSIGLFGHEVK